MEQNIKLLVVACNTASALALSALQNKLPALPCLGVIEPGAQQAASVSATGHIAVLATESTMRSGAYAAAIKHYRPAAQVKTLACNLLVALAEEGWCEGPEAEAAIGRYFHELGADFDTLVLGCTHFPLLAPTIRRLTGPGVSIVDSAITTAQTVQHHLQAQGLRNVGWHAGQSRFWVTDAPERFARQAQRFLGEDILSATELVSLSSDLQAEEPAERRAAPAF